MTADEWLAAFAERLGVDVPDRTTVADLLDIAGQAAHQSERIAAPVACYLVARSGTDVAAALAIARELE